MQCGSNVNTTMWDPIQIFTHHSHYKYAVVILNSPLYWKDDILLQIWKNGMFLCLKIKKQKIYRLNIYDDIFRI